MVGRRRHASDQEGFSLILGLDHAALVVLERFELVEFA